MRSKFTLSSKVFDSFANKLVWYLFKTLPLATRLNPEPMVFLIEVNFRKRSKIGTNMSKINKVRKLWHLCCNLDDFHTTFCYPIALWIPYWFNALVIGSSTLQKLSWFEQKVGFVFQVTRFFVVPWFFGCFWGQFHLKMQLFLQNCLLELPGLVNVEYFKPFNARMVLKICTENKLEM